MEKYNRRRLKACAVFLCAFSYAVFADSRASPSDCPSHDFPHFLSAFSEHVDAQERYIGFPLEKQHLDKSAEPEPKLVVERLPASQVALPVMPSNSERTARTLSLSTAMIDENNAKVFLMKADTDFQVIYFFRKDACWSLYRIEDWSL